MPVEVLTQLRALRESIADSMRKDPRFLTLAALDKSIVEITGVLSASGLIPPEPVAPSPMHFDPPHAAAAAAPPTTATSVFTPPAAPAPTYAAPAAAPAPRAQAAPAASTDAMPPAAPVAAMTPVAPSAPPAVAPPAPPVATPAEPAIGNGKEVKKKKKSILKPALATAGVLAAAGIAAEVAYLAHGKPMGKAPPKGEGASDDVPAEPEPDPDPASKAAEAKGTAEPGAGTADDAGTPTGSDAGNAPAAANAVIPKGKAAGYVPMQAKEGATQYQPAISVKFGKLPNKVDLRPLMTPVEDQGETSSCVANAVAGAYEYWIKKATKQDTNISRLFVYYNARWRDGSQDKDDGSVIQLAMDGLSKFGACEEKIWPFDTHLVTKKPGADAYEAGAPWKVQDMAQVPLKLESWKQALAEGKPIVFGIALFDSFDECSKRGGVVSMPSPDDVARASHSGHSMCAVGYSDTEKVFIVRNSWGKDWGDKGYCYMPYAYLLNPKFNDSDSWVFVPKVPMQPPREVWSDDTKPVTNDGKGVDFEIEPFKIDDYKHVAFDFFDRVRKPFNTSIGEDFAEYVSFAKQSLWSSMASFDYKTFLASTVALAGVATATSAIASEFSSTSSSETSTSESSEAHAESLEQSETDESSDEDSDESSEEEDDDDAEDDESDEDGDDDAEDGDSDEDGDGDGDAEDDDSEEDGDDDAEDGDSDEDGDGDGDAEDDDSDEDGDDDAEDGDSEEDDDDDAEDGDSDEDGDDDAENDESDDSDEDAEDDGEGEGDDGDD